LLFVSEDVRYLSDFFNNAFINLNLKDMISNIASYVGFKSPLDVIRAVIDIGIVGFVIYKLFILVKETRAIQLIKGILVILITTYLSYWLGLRTVYYILSNTIQLIGITLVVLFQPELRRALEQIGRSRFGNLFSSEDENIALKTTATIEEIIKTATEMAKSYTGVLIIIERETKIGEVINTGVHLDSNVSSELLINIFTPNTPLHDGAVIIRDNKVKAAACFLPLTDNPNLSKELGTRHRAALGITEISDAIAVVVSEETGKISFALNGGLTRNLTSDILRKALNKNLLEKYAPSKKKTIWKVKSK
jgi:diadenylate cyclase